MNAILTGLAEGGGSEPADLVRLSGVHKHFRQGELEVHALRDIALRVAAGDIVAICGPSGSGKTTLLNQIGMLDSPSEGSVVVAGLLVSKLSEPARADLRCEMMGFVFQCFSLIPALTALENVLLPLTLRRNPSPAARHQGNERAAELLARVGLASRLHVYPERLNPGERQRVAVARALVAQPRLVLADEPTGCLDRDSAQLVTELFAAVRRQHNTSFIVSTRDQRALPHATRTLQLCDGQLAPANTGPGRRVYSVPS